MIRAVIIVCFFMMVSGALSYSFLPMKVPSKVFIKPEWKSLEVDPVLMTESSLSSYKTSLVIDSGSMRLWALPARSFPYILAGYVHSGSLSLVIIKDASHRKEWILAKGDYIPDSNGYQLEQINETSVLLTSKETEKKKTLTYGKEALENLFWQLQLPDGSSVEMQTGDVIEFDGQKWELVEHATDPPSATLVPLSQFYVHDASL